MPKTSRLIVLMVFLFAPSLTNQAQESSDNTIFQQFSLWGSSPETDRLYLYAGFTNGYFAAPAKETAKKRLSDCIIKNIPTKQAIAMIDKYYKDNPQRWSTLLAFGILEALTVKDGPCPGLNPFD